MQPGRQQTASPTVFSASAGDNLASYSGTANQASFGVPMRRTGGRHSAEPIAEPFEAQHRRNLSGNSDSLSNSQHLKQQQNLNHQDNELQKQMYMRTGTIPGTAAYLSWQEQVFSGTSGGGVNGHLIPSRQNNALRMGGSDGKHRGHTKNSLSLG